MPDTAPDLEHLHPKIRAILDAQAGRAPAQPERRPRLTIYAPAQPEAIEAPPLRGRVRGERTERTP